MAYYLSGALASQASASVAQVLTASIYPAGGFYSYKNREWMNLALSPSGEYFAQSTLYGTGAYDINNETTSFSPSIVIWQSSSATGYSPMSEVKVKAGTALNSNNVQYDVENLIGATFVSNTTIVHAVGAYDPQDGSSVQTYGTFLVITGSGATWGVSQALSATVNSTTAQAASRDTPANWNEDSIVVTVNNKHTSTDTTRVAIHSTCDGDGPTTTKQPRVTVYSQSGGTWAFHSQFSVNDINGPLSTDVNVSIQDVTWIDEDLMGIVFQLDGSSSNLSYTTLVKYDGADWAAFGGNGKQVTMNSNDSYINHAASGIRMIEWDEVNERLYLQAAGTFYIWDSGSNWAADDFGGNTSVSNGAADSISLATTVSQDGPWQGPMFADFKFSTGNATLISTYPGNPSSYGDSEIVYAESGSSGWAQNLYSTNEYGYFTDTDISTSGFSPAIDSDANILKSSWRPVFGDHTGRTFAWNNLGGGDANTFIYREGGQDPSHGYDSGRAIVLDLGAFPGSNPALASTANETIGSSGGTISAGGTEAAPTAKLTFPASALSGDKSISISTTEENDPKINGINETANLYTRSYSKLLRVTLPASTTLSKAVTVELLHDSDADTSKLVLLKREASDAPWYVVPASSYSVGSGKISFTTHRFSDYQAVEDQNMARTKINNTQLLKLTAANSILGGALDITGSTAIGEALSSNMAFVVQSGSETPKKILASEMATFFNSNVSVTSVSNDAAHKIVFVDAAGAGQSLQADNDSLTFNPDSNLLTVGGSVVVGDGSNIGPASVTDLIELQADGDIIIKDGAYDFDIASHDGTNGLLLGGVTVTATAAELNYTDVATAGTVEANKAVILDSGKNATGFGNITAHGNLSGSSLIVGLANLSQADLEQLDGITAGTVAANKAVVVDANKDAGSFRNLTASADIRVEGNLTSDGGNSQTIFAATSGPGQTITIGGGSKVIAAGNLQVNGTAIDVDSASALAIGATVGANNLTLGANTSTVVIPGSGSISGDLTITGNLQVDGDQVIINTTVLEVEDKTILIASGSANDAAANGAGLIVESGEGNKTFTFNATGDRFVSTENFDIASGKVYKINNTEVLSATGLTIGDAALSEADLEQLDGITAGTVAASKAVVVDANKDALGFRNLSSSLNVSASAFYGDGSNLTGVGAEVATSAANTEFKLSFVTDAAADAASLLIDSTAHGTYNPSSNKLGVAQVSSSADLVLRGGKADDVQIQPADTTGDVVLFAKGGTLGNSNGFIFSGSDDKGLMTLVGNGSNSQKLQIEAGGSIAAIKGDMALSLTAGNGTATVTSTGASAVLQRSGGAKVTTTDTTVQLNTPSGAGRTIEFHNNGFKAGEIQVYTDSGNANRFDIKSAATHGVAISASAGGLGLSGSTGIKLESVLDTAIDVASDSLYFKDADGLVKSDTVADVVAGAAGDGLTAASGVLTVAAVEKTFYSASSNTGADGGMSTDLLTASLDNSGDGNALANSLEVYLNGMLQTISSSVATGVTGVFDYKVDNASTPTEVRLVTAIDDDDVLIIKYLKK